MGAEFAPCDSEDTLCRYQHHHVQPVGRIKDEVVGKVKLVDHVEHVAGQGVELNKSSSPRSVRCCEEVECSDGQAGASLHNNIFERSLAVVTSTPDA